MRSRIKKEQKVKMEKDETMLKEKKQDNAEIDTCRNPEENPAVWVGMRVTAMRGRLNLDRGFW